MCLVFSFLFLSLFNPGEQPRCLKHAQQVQTLTGAAFCVKVSSSPTLPLGILSTLECELWGKF